LRGKTLSLQTVSIALGSLKQFLCSEKFTLRPLRLLQFKSSLSEAPLPKGSVLHRCWSRTACGLKRVGPWSNSGWKGPLEVTYPPACTKQVYFWQVAQGLVLLNLQLPHILKCWSSFFRPLWSLDCVETNRGVV